MTATLRILGLALVLAGVILAPRVRISQNREVSR